MRIELDCPETKCVWCHEKGIPVEMVLIHGIYPVHIVKDCFPEFVKNITKAAA